MNKIVKTTMIAALACLPALMFASANVAIATYPEINLQHDTSKTLDLSKGNPMGMVEGITYTFTCQTTGTGDAVIGLTSSTSKWLGIEVNGKEDYANAFKLTANSSFVIKSLNTHLPNGYSNGELVISNLDNTSNVVLNCSATPVL